jgi:hypothetical protein
MWRAGGAAIAAATMTMWCGAASAATVITDPAGDANGLGNAGLDQATGPVNDAARDLTRVTVSSDGGALSVAFTTSAPLDQGPVQTFARLTFTTAKCPVSLIAYAGGTASDGSTALLPMADAFDCGGFLSTDGYSVTPVGNTVTVRFPYDALQRAGAPISAGTTLTRLKADTFEGTITFGNGFCSGDPTICTVFNAVPPRHREYVGPLIDKTAEAARFTARRRR